MPKPSEKRITKGLWWDKNWPVLEGCTPCSPACSKCFAKDYVHRFKSTRPYYKGLTDDRGNWTGTVLLRNDQLERPLQTKKPAVWFVAERSDLFHPDVPFEFILAVLAHAVAAPQHHYMVLTKRPERMAEFFRWMNTEASYRVETMRPCFWFGATVWDQKSADRNIPHLLLAPVQNRFISVEPMLGPVNIKGEGCGWCYGRGVNPAYGTPCPSCFGIDWVICGGESGPGARPVHPDWVRSLRDQCQAAGVPFFFKQWGEWHQYVLHGEHGYDNLSDYTKNGLYLAPPSRRKIINGLCVVRIGKKAAGLLLDGKEHLELPE